MSADEDWYADPVGLSPLVMKDVADVSVEGNVSKERWGTNEKSQSGANGNVRLLDASAVE